MGVDHLGAAQVVRVRFVNGGGGDLDHLDLASDAYSRHRLDCECGDDMQAAIVILKVVTSFASAANPLHLAMEA